MKMDLRFCLSCFYLWTSHVLRYASSEPEPAPRYKVREEELTFNQAVSACSPGSLTTLRSEHEVQEVQQVLRLVAGSEPATRVKVLRFWVGLKKVQSDCVIRELPLRGFRWVVDQSEDTQVSRWWEEPEHTCTLLRCAALALELSGSDVTRWGLVPVSCKNQFKSICKLEGSQELQAATVNEPHDPTPTEPAAEPTQARTLVTPGPDPTPRPASSQPKSTTEPSAAPQVNATDREVQTEPATRATESDPKPIPGSRLCSNPDVDGSRSLTLDPDDVNRVLLECWSGVQLPLLCSGRVWRLLDDSLVDASTVCRRCSPGFRKNRVGKCEDVNECDGGDAACRHVCLNLPGSYRCVCSDQEGRHHEEDSPECSAQDRQPEWVMGILVPVLVAVAVLLVLLVVVGVTVKCCLRRRSNERAVKKMESKEDDFETANEKTAA